MSEGMYSQLTRKTKILILFIIDTLIITLSYLLSAAATLPNNYISIETIGDDMLSYGHIKNINEINHNNILVIERQDKRVYLKRYYG